MADAAKNIWDYAEIGVKQDAEKDRQTTRTAESKNLPPPDKDDIWGQAEQQVTAEAPESGFKKAGRFIVGTGLPVAGAAGGAALGTMFPILGPATPFVGESAGGAAMEYVAQKLGVSDPSKTAIALQALAPGVGKLVKPAGQFIKETTVKTLAGRANVAEAAESLLTKWLNPAVKAADLYAQAEGTRAMIPYGTTAKAVDDIVKTELRRMPTATKREILNILEPISQFTTPAGQQGRKGFQMITQQPVSDAMAEVRRLGSEVRQAFKADKSDVGNALNKVRAALLDDLEKAGVPEVKAASQAYRKEMAIEDLSRFLGKPQPGVKLSEYVKKNPLFEKTFKPAEWDQINRIVKKLEFVTPSGGSGVIGKTILTGAGEVLGEMLGLPPAVGGAIGFGGTELLRNLLSTPTGRNFTERVLADRYMLGGQKAAMLASIARALGGQALQERARSQQEQ